MKESLQATVHDINLLNKELLPKQTKFEKKNSISYSHYFSTNIEKSHILVRRINTFMALREFLQNALDSAEISRTRVEILEEKGAITIKDYGKGLTLEAFRIGGSEKECWQRGRYGEGLKIGLGYFVLIKDVPVFVISRGKAYRAINYDDMLFILIGDLKKKTEGTEIRIEDKKDYKKLTKIMNNITYDKNKILDSISTRGYIQGEYCDKPRISSVLDIPDSLYVGDIYVNSFSKIINVPSIFGYNMWHVSLEQNRVDVTNIDELIENVAAILNNIEEESIYQRFIDKTIDLKKRKNRDADYFESKYVLRIAKAFAKKTAEILKSKIDNIVMITKAERRIAEYSLPDYNILEINKEELYDSLPLPKLSQRMFEKAKKEAKLAKKTDIDYSRLTLNENCNLALFYVVYFMAKKDILLDLRIENHDLIDISTKLGSKLGHYIPSTNKIQIKREILSDTNTTLETAIEETAHKIGFMSGMSAEDITREFEDKLIEVSRNLLKDDCSFILPAYKKKLIVKEKTLEDLSKLVTAIDNLAFYSEVYELIERVRIALRKTFMKDYPTQVISSIAGKFGSYYENAMNPDPLKIFPIEGERGFDYVYIPLWNKIKNFPLYEALRIYDQEVKATIEEMKEEEILIYYDYHNFKYRVNYVR